MWDTKKHVSCWSTRDRLTEDEVMSGPSPTFPSRVFGASLSRVSYQHLSGTRHVSSQDSRKACFVLILWRPRLALEDV